MQSDRHLPAGDADPWLDLQAELDRWLGSGLTAGFWWRDDDATRPGPKLDRLLDIAGETPLALAVIPALAGDSLAACLSEHVRQGGNLAALQHGYAHVNHAPAGEKKAEFGDHRPLQAMLDELIAGRNRMEALFGERFEPILTPPWNRVGSSVAGALEKTGLRRLSCFGPQERSQAGRAVNTHIDIIDWHGGRGFVGEQLALHATTTALVARRTGEADIDEPVGLLTHHLDHDEACWRFIARFVVEVTQHPAASWVLP
jgi:hypothetical protein